MTIANTFASKLFVGVVAIAMALSLVAPAQAQTEEELQAQIDQLMATITALQSQTGATATGSSTAGVCPYAWTRALSSGSTGADVMALQKFLNADVATQVAAAGAAGSAGMETEYFGPATAAAVSNFQVKYRDDVLTPLGLVNPTGFFGQSSMAKANALCASAAPTTPTDGGDGDGDGDSEELSGEGTLDTFEVDDDEDQAQEGEEDVVVMVITAEATDGDIEMDRMAFALTDPTTGGGEVNDESDPWDVFEEVSLWVDGEKVADFDASDEDNFLNEDIGTFRFSGLDLVLMEDEETEILVAVTVAGSVDSAGDADVADWELEVTSVRYFDADGVATDENEFDELPGAVVFDIVEEGNEDEATIESNSANPDPTTLKVEDNSSESEEYVVHIFDIEVDRDSSDLVLEDAFIDVTLVNPTGAVDIDGGQKAVIADIMMTIDGETVTGEATALGADEEGDEIADAGEDADGTTVRYRFEFDGLDLDADTDYEVEVAVVFEGTDDGDAYPNSGVTIVTEVTDGTLWEVEGLAGDNILTGDDASAEHTLATVVPVITDVSVDVDRNDAQTGGTISFEFTVEADGDDNVVFDVDDILFEYISTAATPLEPVPGLIRVSGDAEEDGGEWTVEEGDEATFALDFTYAAALDVNIGTYRVTLDSVMGVEVDETSTALNLTESTE